MRDRTLDGYRAIAALGVVFAHAVDYRYSSVSPHFAQRLADPLATTSVQIFFVISGYIITSLLLRERARTGRILIPAFYIRRVCRIMPPMFAMILATALLGLADGQSLAMASTFTCNIGECSWGVAHTWSLSVEEQFYLIWPMLLVIFSPKPSVIFAAIGACQLAFFISPATFHSNYISFACIGVGVLYASAPEFRQVIGRLGNPAAWLGTAAFLVLAPLYLSPKLELITPFLIAYLLFGSPILVKALLSQKPLQIIGLSSYSLYLWQQVFLAKSGAFSIWMLPVAVALSVLLIERPFIRLGKRLSDDYARSSEILTTPME